jgi:hypothetical protein
VSSAGRPPFDLSLLGDRGTHVKRVAEERASSLTSKGFRSAKRRFVLRGGVQKELVFQRFLHDLVLGRKLSIFFIY